MDSKSRPLVFVSHSSEDVEFSHQLVSDLREEFGEEVEVWHDSSGGLKGGDAPSVRSAVQGDASLPHRVQP